MFRCVCVKSCPPPKQRESIALSPVFVRVYTLSPVLNFHKEMHSCSHFFPFSASLPTAVPWASRDRKSTRLNSSHGYISYAVFCLKKKNRNSPTGCARRAPFLCSAG